MAVVPRTSAGLIKFRPVRRGSRVALVAPASPVDRAEFDAGVAELRRLGFDPVWDDEVFSRHLMMAGTARERAAALQRAFDAMDADAVMAVRGGYGSVEVLPLLNAGRLRSARTAFVGYSDVTSLHSYLAATVGLTSVHGAMIERRLAGGAAAYDAATFVASLGVEPIGELSPPGLESLTTAGASDASGPLVGGTLTQLLASLGTPYEFHPPHAHVLLLDEVNERPYRLHRMLTQLRLSGRLAHAAAIVFGELPGCDEPGGQVSARDAIRDALDGFTGPVLIGFPTGHTSTPTLSVPLGVRTRVVVAPARSCVVIEESAAA